MHILRFPLIGNKGDDAPVAVLREKEASFLPCLPQQALLRALILLKLAANADPLVVVEIVFLFDPVQKQHIVPSQHIAQGGIFHGAFLLAHIGVSILHSFAF